MAILTFLASLLLVLLLAVAAMFLLGPLWARIYRLEDSPEEIHYFKADDGWTLSMSRRRPEKQVKNREPVILCHGLSANRFNLDFDRTYSVARYLASEGFDAWVLELRGIGRSARRRFFTKGRWAWGFDDFVRKDAPAAVAHVLKVTGAKKVHWVGHSMGGMIAYGLCQLESAQNVKSAVAIAGPGHFGFHPELGFMAGFRPLVRRLRYVPMRAFAWMGIPLIGRARLRTAYLNYNEANIDTVVVRQALASLAHPISARLAGEFLGWIADAGEVVGADGYSYSAGISGIKTPFFFIAGSMDHLGTIESVRYAYEAASSKDKKLRIFGREHGDAADYGHGDMVMGKAAPYEVFPAVRDWLVEHSAR